MKCIAFVLRLQTAPHVMVDRQQPLVFASGQSLEDAFSFRYRWYTVI